MAQPRAPEVLTRWMAPFAVCFTRPTWRNAPVLPAGAVLAPGRRTVSGALSVTGLRRSPSFTNVHRALDRGRWSSRAVARRLFERLVAAPVPDGPVVAAIDETLERRWGARIGARGLYRDPVRSSRGHVVKASGLRWISAMPLTPIPWAGRVRALPSLTALAPSARFARAHGRRHKALTGRARQILPPVERRLPDRPLVAAADGSYAAILLLDAVRARLTMVARPRLDARPFEPPPPPRRPGTVGRPRVGASRAWTAACTIRRRRGAASGSPAGPATPAGCSTSPPGPRCGTTPARGCRSAGCWCAPSPARSSRRRSCAPTWTPTRSTSRAGSCAAGRTRPSSGPRPCRPGRTRRRRFGPTS